MTLQRDYGSIKEHLIIQGIKEIEEHGLLDFSLRRVSNSCDVSCAAPYKHFKNKDDFILAIIIYISEQWKLLETQIIKIYKGDTEKLIEELSTAYIKFWLANPNFRTILLMNPRQMDDAQKNARADIDKTFFDIIVKYFKQETDAKNSEPKIYEVKSLIYGALLMLESGEMSNNENSISLIKSAIRDKL